MFALKKITALATAGLVLASLSAATVEPAYARNGRNAALVGGLAAGALLGGALANPGYRAYAQPAYPYYPAYPRYGAYDAETGYAAPVIVRPCYRERQPVYNYEGDFVGYRRVRVCH